MEFLFNIFIAARAQSAQSSQGSFPAVWWGRRVRPIGDRRGFGGSRIDISVSPSSAVVALRGYGGARGRGCQFLPLPRPRTHPGPAGLARGHPWSRPGGFDRGFPAPDPLGAGAIALIVASTMINVAFARFCRAGELSLGMAGGTVMVAGAGCLLGAWVAARPRSVRLSTRCIDVPRGT